MNAKKLLTISALLIAASTIPSYSYADRGGDSAGGGNTINHQLIEDYAINPKDLGAGYELAMKKLEKLKERVPGFAARIEHNMKNYSWYLIPGKIRELPSERTGLHFPTDQTAYQQDEEIFISDSLSSLTPEKQSQLLMHELLMTESDKKDVARVRKLMVYLRQNNFEPEAKELSEKIRSLGFGYERYLTPVEIKKIDEEVLADIRPRVKAGIDKLIAYCVSEESNGSNWNRNSGEEKITRLQRLNVGAFDIYDLRRGSYQEKAVDSEIFRVTQAYLSDVTSDAYVNFVAAMNLRHKKGSGYDGDLASLTTDILWAHTMFEDGKVNKLVARSDEFSSLSTDERFSLACKNIKIVRKQVEALEKKSVRTDREVSAQENAESAPAN